jgi:hypothetical protein
MSKIKYQEFKDNLTNIPEPPEDKLNTDHLREPFEALKELTDGFEKSLTEDILTQMILKSDDSVDFIRYMLNESQNSLSQDLAKHTPRSSFSAQVNHITDHPDDARAFASYLLDEYGETLDLEMEMAREDIAREKLLAERYTEKRRAGLEGQQHGVYIEDRVEEILESRGLREGSDYHKDRNPPYGSSNKDVDFVIPELKLLIECKGYVTSGSKLYDAVGDISKVNHPGDWNFMLVLDGQILADQDGLLRDFESALERGTIDGMYQLEDLDTLETQIQSLQSGNSISPLHKTRTEMQANLTEIPTEELDISGLDEVFLAFDQLEQTYDTQNPVSSLADALGTNAQVLDVLRLILDRSEDRFATEIHPFIDGSLPYDKILDLIADDSKGEYAKSISQGLHSDENIQEEIEIFLDDQVEYFDIVANRYMQKAGKAIKSRYTGNYLEDIVEDILSKHGLERNKDYYQDQRAKFKTNGTVSETDKGPDFVLPSLENPDVIIEAKGYSSTGSKQSDVAGDMREKIVGHIPEEHRDDVEVILVTDGGSWRLREPDLKTLVELHNNGVIDGLYQISTLEELEKHITSKLDIATQGSLQNYGSS